MPRKESILMEDMPLVDDELSEYDYFNSQDRKFGDLFFGDLESSGDTVKDEDISDVY